MRLRARRSREQARRDGEQETVMRRGLPRALAQARLREIVLARPDRAPARSSAARRARRAGRLRARRELRGSGVAVAFAGQDRVHAELLQELPGLVLNLRGGSGDRPRGARFAATETRGLGEQAGNQPQSPHSSERRFGAGLEDEHAVQVRVGDEEPPAGIEATPIGRRSLRAACAAGSRAALPRGQDLHASIAESATAMRSPRSPRCRPAWNLPGLEPGPP